MFNKIIFQKEAALNPWYLTAVTQLMTATEAHLSGWLSHELGEWRKMRVLVSKLGGGLRASSLPAPIMWKPQSYKSAFPSFRTLWALLAFLPSSQKDNKRPSLSQWAAQTPLSSPHLHLTGFGNCRFLVWAKSPQGYKRCLKHASLSQPAQKGKVNRNGWMDGWRDPRLQKEPWTGLQGETGGFLNSTKWFSFEI